MPSPESPLDAEYLRSATPRIRKRVQRLISGADSSDVDSFMEFVLYAAAEFNQKAFAEQLEQLCKSPQDASDFAAALWSSTDVDNAVVAQAAAGEAEESKAVEAPDESGDVLDGVEVSEDEGADEGANPPPNARPESVIVAPKRERREDGQSSRSKQVRRDADRDVGRRRGGDDGATDRRRERGGRRDFEDTARSRRSIRLRDGGISKPGRAERETKRKVVRLRKKRKAPDADSRGVTQSGAAGSFKITVKGGEGGGGSEPEAKTTVKDKAQPAKKKFVVTRAPGRDPIVVGKDGRRYKRMLVRKRAPKRKADGVAGEDEAKKEAKTSENSSKDVGNPAGDGATTTQADSNPGEPPADGRGGEPIQCKFHPNCRNPKCTFYHPTPQRANRPRTGPAMNCRYGSFCKRPDCRFRHPFKNRKFGKSKTFGDSTAPTDGKDAANANGEDRGPCRYDPKCHRPNCFYSHPKRDARRARFAGTPADAADENGGDANKAEAATRQLSESLPQTPPGDD